MLLDDIFDKKKTHIKRFFNVKVSHHINGQNEPMKIHINYGKWMRFGSFFSSFSIKKPEREKQKQNVF